MSDPKFLKAKASLVFSGVTLVVSLVFLILAVLVKSSDIWETLLSHLAAMGIAAFVASVFFQFRDVRELVAGSVAQLLLQGGVASELSNKARLRLRNEFLLADLGTDVSYLPVSLMEYLEGHLPNWLAVPHFKNFSSTINLTEVEGNPGLVRRHYRRTNLIDCRHLKDGCATIPLELVNEFSTPTAVPDDKIVERFSVRVGTKCYDMTDMKIVKERSGGLNVVRTEFKKQIDVAGEVELTIDMVALANANDPTEIQYAAYPTKGFRATLLYKPGMIYASAWFSSWTQQESAFPGTKNTEEFPTGIAAYMNDWLLPGSGVILFWFPPNAFGPT
jgi:hypothetical protein